MINSIKNVAKLNCSTGGVWTCDIFNKGNLNKPAGWDRFTSVKFCNVGRVESDNEDVVLIFDKPMNCGIEKGSLNCGCPR